MARQAAAEKPAKNDGPEKGLVRLALAHPLHIDYAAQIGLDPALANSPEHDEFVVGTILDVPVNVAPSMIAGGLVQVDPEDKRVVEQVMAGTLVGSHEAIHGAVPTKSSLVSSPEVEEPAEEPDPAGEPPVVPVV